MIIEAATLTLFITSALLLSISPGPDNVFVLTLSMARGPLAGIVTTLGLCTGLIVHTSAVALGVAVLIQESELAFSLLKIGGALYLLWLAWQAFRHAADPIEGRQSTEGLRRLYLRGILMNVMNPKVSLFFLAFLPQFVDAGRGSVTLQIFLLGFVFFLCGILVFGAISLAAGRLGDRFRKGSGAKILHRVSAGVFAGLAIKLLLSER
jgi:threonine/homoserine/homoserine lactone efflux protein